MSRRVAWALLLASALAGPLRAAPHVEVAVEPSEGTVGDRITAVVRLLGSAEELGPSPQFPEWSRGWGDGVEVLEAGPVEALDAGAGLWQKLTIAAFRVGEIELPPVVVRLPGGAVEQVASAAGPALTIRSVLPEGAEEVAPRPPAPPRGLPVPPAFWWTVGALALAALVAALWLRAHPRLAAGAEAPRLPPIEELERELGELRSEEPIAGHARLSLALRRYLGRSFAMPAAESTTRELQARLGERGLAVELVRRTVRLLREVDPVKFARQPATAEELARRSDEARAIAGDVELHLNPPAPAEEAA